MKPIHFQLAATGLLAVCLFLVVQKSDRKTPVTRRDVAPVTRNSPGAPVAIRHGGPTALPARRAGSNFPAGRPAPLVAEAPSASRQASGVFNPPVSAGPGLADNRGRLAPETSVPPANSPGRGIQLAANVRLPAAIMALGSREMNVPGHPPTPADDAAREIENTFYQELAATAGEPPDKPLEADATTVISPGREVETARARADEIYRSLFGDEAYNRQSMTSAIEVQLPEDSAAGQP